MHSTPDGMGADRHRERQNMKAARQETHAPPWELRALDADGEELYRTEAYPTREAAQADCDAFADGSAYWADNVPDSVDKFEPVRRDE